MVPRSLLLVSTMISAALLAACGGGEKYYIPADNELKPFQKPERDALVAGEEEDSWEDLDFDEASADEESEEEGEGEAPEEDAAEEEGESGEGAKKTPEVTPGEATATGSLDKNIIRRYIRRSLPRFRYCYEKQLVKKPKLEGTVNAKFVIGPDGKVTESKASGFPDKKVSECVSKTVRAIVFPKPKGGGNVVVRYPFTFKSG